MVNGAALLDRGLREKMMKGNDRGESGSFIRTFLRIRPSKQSSGFIKVDEHSNTRLGFHVPVETRDGEVRPKHR